MKRLDQENKNTVSEDHAEKIWKGIKIQTGNEKKKNGEKQAGRECWVGFKEKRGRTLKFFALLQRSVLKFSTFCDIGKMPQNNAQGTF